MISGSPRPENVVWQKLLAESLGTGVLAFAIVGSGAHAASLTDSAVLALLINSLATAAVLGVLISLLLPVSGAHFNPAVTLGLLVKKTITPHLAIGFILVQILSAIVGTMLAASLFSSDGVAISDSVRMTTSAFVGEIIATAGLVAIVASLAQRGRYELLPVTVASWIGAGYFVTPSTGFANPAITIGRIFTDGYTGIEPFSAGWFVLAQLVGATGGILIARLIRTGH